MTKQSIVLAVVAVIVLGAVAFFTLSKPDTPPTETSAPVTTTPTTTNTTTNDVEQDLNQIDATNFDKDFENVNQDINGL